MAIRTAAVAGTFYPGREDELARSVDEMLSAAGTDAPSPKAVIAPHAGYVYSGPIAASVYARLKNAKTAITRVVLLGPSHRVGFRGIALPSDSAYETPLGRIPIDQDAIQKIQELPGVGLLNEAHIHEHSLEVHLPFLQRLIPDFELTPLVIGDADPEDVARVLDTLWGGDETLVVISSDLSHYHDYDQARKLDTSTSRRIIDLHTDLKGEEACGCRPINGLLHLAGKKNLTVETVDLRNSGDTAGTRDRVVGYGAYVLVAKQPEEQNHALPLSHRQRLIQVARNAVLQPLVSKDQFNIELNQYPASFREERASFVTLKIEDRLRGCIGSLSAHRPLVADVANNAQSAAFKDPRFKPLTLEEYQDIDMHISILSPPIPLAVSSREELLEVIRPGTDGLIIEEGGARATYLPSVWEQLPDAQSFVSELRRKAGLNPKGWSRITRVSRYTTDEFC